MKKFYKLIASVLLTIILFSIFFIGYNKYLDKQINALYNESVAAYYGATIKNGGEALQSLGIQKNDFMLYGSSELGSNVPQNPTRLFPTKDNNFIVDVVGRGYCQSLEHDINLGALSNQLKGKKIAFVVSIQWFLENEGIAPDNFTMNFSELQFYDYMMNKNISDKSKENVAARVLDLTKGNKDYNLANFYAKLYTNKSILGKVKYYLFKPYYFFREKVLMTKDKVQAIKYLTEKKPKPPNYSQITNSNWPEKTKIAEAMGKKAVTNNKFFINDQYYNSYIKDNLGRLKNIDKDLTLKTSLEYNDYEKLLEDCKQLGIKPYIIIMPVNGYFYDYRGLSKETRDEYYNKIESMAKEKGFQTLKMTEQDYEPYFMTDIMHLGWKGWLYVDEKIAQYHSAN